MENSYRGSFKKFTIDDLPHDPEIPPLEYMYLYTHIYILEYIQPKDWNESKGRNCTPTFTAALFIVAKQTQPTCPLTGKVIYEIWYIRTFYMYIICKVIYILLLIMYL